MQQTIIVVVLQSSLYHKGTAGLVEVGTRGTEVIKESICRSYSPAFSYLQLIRRMWMLMDVTCLDFLTL
jgi:hypothetical protein